MAEPTDTTELAGASAVAEEPPATADGTELPATRRWRRRRRISRWDRPPPPKDWRYVVGLFGKVLIVTGLLLFGFVAYQLWGTGIETARAQRRLENEFEELLAAASTVPTPTVAPSTVPATTVPPDTVPGSTVAPTTTVPPTTTTTTTEPRAVQQAIPPIEIGDPIGYINIPAIGVDKVMVAGVGVDQLQDGPGHYPDTPMPGQLGNAAIAGHRTTYGAPFGNVDKLEPGDEIIVDTLAGHFVYRVTGTEIVSPSDYSVIATTNPDIAELTLTSCHPKYSTSKRIIIHSTLVEELSDPVGFPVFYADPAGADAAIAGEDLTDPSTVATAPPSETATTAAAAVATAPDDTASDEATPAATTPAETVPEITVADDDGATAADEPPVLTEATEDAFGRGWFHDPDAWPQVVLWGLAVSAIAVGAYLLARRFRNSWIGIAAGILPFVVALFFFYQNVNRLLPPEL